MLDDFLDEDGRLLNRPTDTKTQEDLDRLVSLGKPQPVIDKVAELVNMTNSWDWCYGYIYYLNDLHDWNNWEPEVTYDADGVEVSRTEKPDEPVEPVKPNSIPNDYERELFKKERELAVSLITVDVDGLVFDGDEMSQARMSRAIISLDDGEEMNWTLADNSIELVSKENLKQALRLAGAKQSELWVGDNT